MRKLIIAAVAALTLSSGTAKAAGGEYHPSLMDASWSFEGIFGRYDQKQLRRGYQIYSEVCASCHSLRLVAYRNLSALGFNEDEIKEIAAEQEVILPHGEDGSLLNDDGDFYTRPGKPSDKFVPPYPNNAAAIDANGALPPDLSLMAKARMGGAQYIYSFLMGFTEEIPQVVKDQKGFSVNEDKAFNLYFPGYYNSMPPQMTEELVEYEDGTPMTAEQHAKDISAFLNWAAEPELDERKSMGLKVMLFLLVLTAMLYALKRKIWANVKH
ncbi:Cytochrome c1 [Candidatus Terasakiella magnetica]|uniref:Cytochrome c1 n=1 Tax=Candidatus Terasakiella magnetica TaxID=1867952 RepID=A0A1C3RGK7_9PROT|nr:cytochrome c1 [Candidatus Terasakiella magnetica]SCA56411.1 Cytochrome c1 [Candidatus Terasakiella magnetica]